MLQTAKYLFLRGRVHVDVDRLRLDVALDTLWTTLTANTALLPSAERRLRRGIECGVDADGASFDLACHAQGAGDV